jgi:hypothetical protein
MVINKRSIFADSAERIIIAKRLSARRRNGAFLRKVKQEALIKEEPFSDDKSLFKLAEILGNVGNEDHAG